MITVEDREETPRLFYLEHKSVRWIARKLDHSRKMVPKALADAGPAVYQRKQPRLSPKMSPFARRVHQWLAEDLNNPASQHLTAHRIYHLLRDKPGFDAAESTVRRLVRLRRLELRPPEIFIPLALSMCTRHGPSDVHPSWSTHGAGAASFRAGESLDGTGEMH